MKNNEESSPAIAMTRKRRKKVPSVNEQDVADSHRRGVLAGLEFRVIAFAPGASSNWASLRSLALIVA